VQIKLSTNRKICVRRPVSAACGSTPAESAPTRMEFKRDLRAPVLSSAIPNNQVRVANRPPTPVGCDCCYCHLHELRETQAPRTQKPVASELQSGLDAYTQYWKRGSLCHRVFGSQFTHCHQLPAQWLGTDVRERSLTDVVARVLTPVLHGSTLHTNSTLKQKICSRRYRRTGSHSPATRRCCLSRLFIMSRKFAIKFAETSGFLTRL